MGKPDVDWTMTALGTQCSSVVYSFSRNLLDYFYLVNGYGTLYNSFLTGNTYT